MLHNRSLSEIQSIQCSAHLDIRATSHLDIRRSPGHLPRLSHLDIPTDVALIWNRRVNRPRFSVDSARLHFSGSVSSIFWPGFLLSHPSAPHTRPHPPFFRLYVTNRYARSGKCPNGYEREWATGVTIDIELVPPWHTRRDPFAPPYAMHVHVYVRTFVRTCRCMCRSIRARARVSARVSVCARVHASVCARVPVSNLPLPINM